jgi:hypothetical protein
MVREKGQNPAGGRLWEEQILLAGGESVRTVPWGRDGPEERRGAREWVCVVSVLADEERSASTCCSICALGQVIQACPSPLLSAQSCAAVRLIVTGGASGGGDDGGVAHTQAGTRHSRGDGDVASTDADARHSRSTLDPRPRARDTRRPGVEPRSPGRGRPARQSQWRH